MILENLTFAYPGCAPLFEGMTLSIPDRSYVALMGPSGCGKSTLARLMKGLLTPDDGSITLNGDSAAAGHGREILMEQVGLVFQNPDNTMVATTVDTELAFGLENLGVPYDEMARLVTDILDRFDLAEYRHTSPSHLSGGEKQRLALAAVMIMRPAFLVLDEPTALLDQPSRRRVLDMLTALTGDGTTILHITPFAEEALAADRVVVLDRNGCAADGNPREVMPYLSGFRSCAFPVRLPGDAAVSTIAESLPDGASRQLADGTSPVLTFDRVGFVYDPKTPFQHRALTDVSWNVASGHATVVLGPSGSGKSTFLELVAGLTVPTEGTVTVAPGLVRAMAFQLPEDQMFGTDVAGYVAFGPLNQGLPEATVELLVRDALEAVGLDPDVCRNRDPLTLSGGEQRLVAIAGVLAMHPGLLVLDEPTAGLDRAGMLRVMEALGGYVDGGGTLLFSTHDGEVAHALARQAMVLIDGHVETVGVYRDVLDRSAWLRGLSSDT